MERTKLRPTVTITTYSASNFNKQQDSNKSANKNHSEEATKAEFSTNFFANKSNRSQARSANNHNISQHLRPIDLSQIKGPTGSIRGHKDVVRKSLEGIKVAHNRRLVSAQSGNFLTSTFVPLGRSGGSLGSLQEYSTISSLLNMQRNNNNNSNWQNLEQLYTREYLANLQEDELNLCVAYTTSLGIIRRTFEDSKAIKSILNLNLIEFEERDIFLNQEYKYQLKLRLDSIIVPAVFVDGKHIGGLKELEALNENGELLRQLNKFKLSTPPVGVCMCCGNARFIACQSCNGSRKSTIHHFKFNSIALRCIKCDKNEGLVQCPVCTTAPANILGVDRVNNIENTKSQSRDNSVDPNNNEPSEIVKILLDDDIRTRVSGC